MGYHVLIYFLLNRSDLISCFSKEARFLVA